LAEETITLVAEEATTTAEEMTTVEPASAETSVVEASEQPASSEEVEDTEEEAASAEKEPVVPGRDYELIYILEPTIDEGQVQEVNGRVRSIVENDGGKIENMRVSELRTLAYPIKKRKEGLYVVINARCEPAPMREVDRVLKLEERVLRHMILRLDED
jgi:small subunit ribosomal protein S6